MWKSRRDQSNLVSWTFYQHVCSLWRGQRLICVSPFFHRYMMLINGKNEVYMIDRDNQVFQIENLEFPFRKDLRVHLANTLLDGVSLFFTIFFTLFSSLKNLLSCHVITLAFVSHCKSHILSSFCWCYKSPFWPHTATHTALLPDPVMIDRKKPLLWASTSSLLKHRTPANSTQAF